MTTVREYSTPLQVPTEEHENLTGIVLDNAARRPEQVVYRRQVERRLGTGDRAAVPRRGRRAGAKGFAAAGVQGGDRVALMARTRYEWSLVDFAVWFAGGDRGPDLRDVLG